MCDVGLKQHSSSGSVTVAVHRPCTPYPASFLLQQHTNLNYFSYEEKRRKKIEKYIQPKGPYFCLKSGVIPQFVTPA